MRRIPPPAFLLLLLLILILAAGTLVERLSGTATALSAIYHSAWFIVLWGLLTAAALWRLYRQRTYRQPVTFLIHLSLVGILAGALLTHFTGSQGLVRLRIGASMPYYETDGGRIEKLPFAIELTNFRIHCYAGTTTPSDFVSQLRIRSLDGRQRLADGAVSMNRVYGYGGYRFFQSSYDDDRRGATLMVASDAYGRPITYASYGLLFFAFVCFFFHRRTAVRTAFRRAFGRAIPVLFLLFWGAANASATTDLPRTISPELAAAHGKLLTIHQGRICPLQTLARDFTAKLCGASTWRGLTAEQVLAGWLYFPQTWISEPMIRIRDADVRKAVRGGVNGCLSMADFVDEAGDYRLADVYRAIADGEEAGRRRALAEADEKYALVQTLLDGRLVKLFPVRTGNGVSWFAQNDRLPDSLSHDLWLFIRRAPNLICEQVARRHDDEAASLIDKIARYQRKTADETLPHRSKLAAERLFNRLPPAKTMAIAFLTVGIASLGLWIARWFARFYRLRHVARRLDWLLSLAAVYQTFTVGLQTYISGRLPLSNGYETLILMATLALLLAFSLYRRSAWLIPAGFLLSGFCLLVAGLSEANPQLTPLLPVLASPLLSVHVLLIMLAYTLCGFLFLISLTDLFLCYGTRASREGREQLYWMSRALLYPTVFLLAAGIFTGAIWANQTWGRYWGWDPKEVWALISLLTYSIPLHTGSLPLFRRPVALHTFLAAAFCVILITYFGVNYFLGGIHSYANA